MKAIRNEAQILEDAVRKTANIIGESSVVSEVLKKLDEEREAGYLAWIERHGTTLLVVSQKQ